MALEIGDQEATAGMTKAIFDEMQAIIEPGLGGLGEEDLESIREGWRKLSLAIATGVVNHILSNMEIIGIHTSGTFQSQPVETVQSDDGPGHVV